MKLAILFQKLTQAVLFPQACVLCDTPVLNEDFSPLCGECRRTFRKLERRVCHYCGIPVPGNILEVECICSRCRKNSGEFDWSRAWGSYEGSLRRAIRRFKFDGFQRLAGPLSLLLYEALQESTIQTEFDWIVPVPSHPGRRRRRGFDHTRLLARNLSARLALPVCGDLKRVKETRPQFGLDRTERKQNLRGAFTLGASRRLYGSNVLLVDDILTTGTTVGEASRVLRSEGRVEKILALVVARTLISIEN